MTKAVGENVALIMGGYKTLDEAEQDWKLLKESNLDAHAHMYDLAVIGKADDGTVAVLKDLHHKVRRGTVIGAVVAVATPVGLAAGLIGGAAAGKIATHFHKGMSEDDKKSLGAALERHSVMLVALADMELAEPIKESLRSDDVLVQTMTTTEVEVRKLLASFGD